jgi:hypothetical protein
MTEAPRADEAGGCELSARNLAVRGHSHVDIESGAWFSLVDLERHTTNDRVRDIRFCKNPGKR